MKLSAEPGSAPVADAEPLDGFDLPADEMRTVLRRGADLAADYLLGVEKYPVQPQVEPGDVLARLASSPPRAPESWDQIFGDYQDVIEPGITHWNHPGFLAYFAISGSGPGVVAETLAAALNVNAMLWKTSPAATELEERVCDWLRQMVGLPDAFRGHINDTASIGTLLALGAARQRALPEVRDTGLFGSAPLTIYASEQAHSSVDKAAIALGLGQQHLRRIPCAKNYRLDVSVLADSIERDIAAGLRPIAVVATAGTTSTTSVDPIAEIAELCDRHQLWLHVDAAYGGAAAVCPELRPLLDGWQRADSIVINPHKWLFVQTDCSVLLVRQTEALRAAYSVVPAYLQSAEAATNLMDLGVQLGRRFRALKVWMVMRRFGVDGVRARLRRHCELASGLATWIEQDADFELAAPVPLSVVCFRSTRVDGDAADAFHRRLLARVNAEGSQLLSATELDGRTVMRIAIGNLRTELGHVEHAWAVVQRQAEQLLAEASGTTAVVDEPTAER